MSETIVRKVRTVFEADMSAMESAIGRSGAQALEAQRKLHGLSSAFAGLGKYIAGAVGVMALKNLVHFNAGLESTRLGIASLMNAGDGMKKVMTPFSASMKEAEEAMMMMRKAAVDTPATTAQVADAFKTLALRARAAGMATKDLVALSANVATRDMMMGGQGLVQRDIDQLLRGEAGDIATAQLNMHRQRLGEMGRSGRHREMLREVERLLAVGAEEKAAWGNSSEGLFSTLQDEWELFKAELGKPIMTELIKGMKELLKWVEQNRELIANIAKVIGEGIVGGIKLLGAFLDGAAGKFLIMVGIAKSLMTVLTVGLNALKAHPVIAALSLGLAIGDFAAGLINPEKTPQEKFSDSMAEYNKISKQNQELRDRFGGEVFDSMIGKLLASAQKAAAQKLADAADNAGMTLDAFGQKLSGADFMGLLGKFWGDKGFGHGAAAVADWSAAKAESERYASNKEYGSNQDRNGALEKIVRSWNDGQKQMLDRGLLPRATEKDEFGIERTIENAFQALVATVEDGKITFQTKVVKQDNRGARITLNQRIDTNDPSRLAGATLVGAFVGAFARPVSANLGFGGLGISTGGRR